MSGALSEYPRGYVWLKFYVALLDDPQFARLSDGAKARFLELYLLAGHADAAGLLAIGNEPAGIDDLAWMLRQSAEKLSKEVDELTAAKFLIAENGHYRIPNFVDDQGPSQDAKREKWREQQEKHRKIVMADNPNVSADSALSQAPRGRGRGEEDVDGEEEEERIAKNGDSAESVEAPASTPPPYTQQKTVASVAQEIAKKTAPDSGFVNQTLVRAFNDAVGFTAQAKDHPAIAKVLGDYGSPEAAGKRLRAIMDFWQSLAKGKGWYHVDNVDAILEMMPEGKLEDRMRREEYHQNQGVGDWRGLIIEEEYADIIGAPQGGDDG